MPEKWKIPAQGSPGLLLLLIASGMLGNYFKIGLLPGGLNFVFGSIGVLITLRLFGLTWGIVASLAASSVTLFSWGHPYACIVFMLETLFVGLFLRSGRKSLLVADSLFWLLLGIPSVYVLYALVMHIDHTAVGIIMLKQSVNGIFNALAASLILNHQPCRRLRGKTPGHRTVSLRETLFNLLVALVLLPALLITVLGSRKEMHEIESRIVDDLQHLSRDITSHMALWHRDRVDGVAELASRASRHNVIPSDELQYDTILIKDSQPSFHSMYVANADGITIAFSRGTNDRELDGSMIGVDFSDRPYFKELRERRKPVSSGVFMARTPFATPIVVVAVPILRGERFEGYGLGAINLTRIRKIIEAYGLERQVRITLLDSEERVITSTDPDREPLQPFDYKEKGPRRILAGSVTQRMPENDKQPNLILWEHSSYTLESPISTACSWKIVLEASVAPQQRTMYATHLRGFLTMAALAAMAMLIAALLSRWLIDPLEKLATATEDIPVRLAGQQSIEIPVSSVAEIHSLAGNFRSTFELLQQNFRELQDRGTELGKANEALKREIAEREQAREALYNSEEKYRELVENANSIIIRMDALGTITFFNEYAQRFFGYTEEEILGRNVVGTIAPARDSSGDDLEWIIRDVFVCPGAYEHQETENMLRNGERVWISWNNTFVYDESGEISGIHCAGYDVTDRRNAEKALRETKEMLQSLIHASPAGIDVLDREGRILLWNPAAETIYGWSEEEIIGLYNPRIPPEEDAEFRSMLKDVFDGKAPSYTERRRLRKDGSPVFVSLSMAPIRDASGTVVAAMGIFTDITERKRAEAEHGRLQEQLRHTQKMEAIGTLAGGIAHDFNNILGAILGYTEIAMHDTPRDSSARRDLQQVLKGAMRARDLIKQILTFSRDRSDQRPVPVEIGALVKEAVKFLRASIPATIEIRHRIAGESCISLADPSQIHQVLVNLCANAAHAMEEKGGVLAIDLETVELDSSVAMDHRDLRPGRYVKLSVSDTGHGMDATTLEHIFEPYFTTKEVGKGSGLGLAVVHGIVKSHGGTVSVVSQPGAGSMFDVFLPSTNESPPAEGSPVESIRGGTESILFVDDEEMLADMGGKMLERLGYKVIAVQDAGKALEIFRENPQAIDCIITDFTMPHMTGGDLTKAVLEIRPDMPVILATGFNQRISFEQAKRIGARTLLMKPMTLRDLATAVRGALGKRDNLRQT